MEELNKRVRCGQNNGLERRENKREDTKKEREVMTHNKKATGNFSSNVEFSMIVNLFLTFVYRFFFFKIVRGLQARVYL